MIKALRNEMVSHGDRGAIVPISRYDDLKREMEALKTGEYHAWSDLMAEKMVLPNELGFKPRSLISVITPSPKVMLQFNYRGKPIQCVVPPIYSDEDSKDIKVLKYINEFLKPRGFMAAVANNLPKKLLAVHCGLGLYGRNNIFFNEEYGSYTRLLSYVSDVPCDEADWFPIRCMEKCEQCRACVAACPTNAIDSTRRIIDASKCLTAINESAGVFPDWVDKDAHNCLIGCMKCQDVCPGNAHNKNNIAKGVAFTGEETAELLGHKRDEPYSDLLAAKIDATGIASNFLRVLPRNLSVLLQNIH